MPTYQTPEQKAHKHKRDSQKATLFAKLDRVHHIDFNDPENIDVFCTYMNALASMFVKKYGEIDEHTIEKFANCVNRINESPANKWSDRQYTVHKEKDFIAFCKPKSFMDGASTRRFSVSLALECSDGKWRIARPDTYKGGAQRIELLEKLCQ